MGRLEKFVAAFQVFAKYDPNANTGAEHDEFYVYGRELLPEKMDTADLVRLLDLGWSWCEDVDGWRRFT